jgi:hypothetical protein
MSKSKSASSHRARADRTMADTEHALRLALQRLLDGRATHPKHAGRTVRITPASVCREARLSRQPLYANHRKVLDEILAHRKVVTSRSSTAEQRRIQQSARINELEAQVKKALSENLTLVARINEMNSGKLHELPIASRRRS